MNSKIFYGIMGLIVGGLMAWYLVSVISPSTRSNNVKSNMQSSDTLDAHFIEQMIPHHKDAITMAKIALKKSQRPEVKDLANNIIESQSKEINEMTNWYKEWFGRELPCSISSEESVFFGTSPSDDSPSTIINHYWLACPPS